MVDQKSVHVVCNPLASQKKWLVCHTVEISEIVIVALPPGLSLLHFDENGPRNRTTCVTAETMA